MHHNLEELQQILDTMNHVANKYHFQFRAAKCKLVKRRKEKKTNALTLNGEILEEVPTYKYLGEIINNIGNLNDHIAEIERKIRGAADSIIAKTINKEFIGIKMQAIWQMVDAIAHYVTPPAMRPDEWGQNPNLATIPNSRGHTRITAVLAWMARECSPMQVMDDRPYGLFSRWQGGASEILKNIKSQLYL